MPQRYATAIDTSTGAPQPAPHPRNYDLIQLGPGDEYGLRHAPEAPPFVVGGFGYCLTTWRALWRLADLPPGPRGEDPLWWHLWGRRGPGHMARRQSTKEEPNQ